MGRALGVGIVLACACAPAEPRGNATVGVTGVGPTTEIATDAGSSSGAGESTGSSSEGSSTGDESESTGAAAPFLCTPAVAGSPVLAAEVYFDPAQPHPGDTLNVIVRAGNGLAHGDAPPMQLDAETGGGALVLEPTMRAGGDALYYFAIPDVAQGDVCVLGRIDGAPEVAATIAVTPRPLLPPVGAGVFKVVENHQWTCDEQPDFGNELHLWVRDETGAGIPRATIRVAAADSTDLATIYNADSSMIPTTLVTDGDGYVKEYDFWPISEHGLLVLELAVEGAASDIATEITTGWWETDDDGCRYCDAGSPKNVWGHWSHSVVFQRVPDASEICRVPVDHAGQAACGAPGHVLHDPEHVACWSVG